MGSIIDNLKELKDNLAESTKIVAHEFSEKVSNVYSAISAEVEELANKFKDAKDEGLDKLVQERDALKTSLTEYKEVGEEKASDVHEKMVDKLHALNDKIREYNNNKNSL